MAVSSAQTEDERISPRGNAPKDSYNLAYISYFILGTGFLLPWNAYITAVDYFDYIFPGKHVDSVFSVAYMVPCLVFILLLLWWASSKGSNARFRINLGLGIFLLALLIVPVLDFAYIKGHRGLDSAYYVIVGAVLLCGFADSLVQGSLIGSAGELPPEYMQAVVAGTAASGMIISALRIITKAAMPQNTHGLRVSAIIYFVVSIVFMIICLVCYNLVNKLPVIKYYNNLKGRSEESTFLLGNAAEISRESPEDSAFHDNALTELQSESKRMQWSKLWHVTKQIKCLGIGLFLIYVVTLSIFPGCITEDVHSEIFKDWYSIILITSYNLFDLIGKSLTAHYMLESAALAIAGSFLRLLFYPLFYACIHGPYFFRAEIPVTFLTSLLGLTNGYFTSVIMIIAPKKVPFEESELAGILIVLFLVIGLSAGSVLSFFWII
eukprot:TRINITY_DN3883_c0_g1_i1.p1 TRINITY_DN3883_c0_g1~~TRINITY_DN3883_c0_g1_i1.p1  ORF type:complete len:437 (+),score=34.46 TRINITY_DN3883_c0_g1_i1:360-1670(+)